jgi:hypothetical protein
MESKLTNSEIGSSHWFVTLVAKCKHIGEFMKDRQITDEQRQVWGEEIYNACSELLDGPNKENKKYLRTTIDIEYKGDKTAALELLYKNFDQQHAIYSCSSNDKATLFARNIKEVIEL